MDFGEGIFFLLLLVALGVNFLAKVLCNGFLWVIGWLVDSVGCYSVDQDYMQHREETSREYQRRCQILRTIALILSATASFFFPPFLFVYLYFLIATMAYLYHWNPTVLKIRLVLELWFSTNFKKAL